MVDTCSNRRLALVLDSALPQPTHNLESRVFEGHPFFPPSLLIRGIATSGHSWQAGKGSLDVIKSKVALVAQSKVVDRVREVDWLE